LGEIASSLPGFANQESVAHRVASLARDVNRVEAERARREEAVERSRRETKKISFSRLDEKKKKRVSEDDASSSETLHLPARARAALIATRVFGETSAPPLPRELQTRPEPERTTEPEPEPSGRGAVATRRSGANNRPCARTSAASVPLPPGARVTAANVASLFATEVVESGDAESDEETRERERR
jgi:hypothetical protein